MKKLRIISIILVIASILVFSQALCFAAEPVEISSVEEFLAIKNNPSGQYILTADLDFGGLDYEPFTFSGSLDGNNHTLRNITVDSGFNDIRTVFDANLKQYEAKLGGLFSVLENATIENLKVANLKVSMDFDGIEQSAFAGGFAGFAYGSSIKSCEIKSEISVKTSGHCFGCGGVFGSVGNSSIENCTITSTLVCTDTDAAYKDEQFMGGVYAFGYSNVNHCQINIEGYDSDHGYVHNGGMVGCFFYYDKQHRGEVSMSHNRVNGYITFFEDNKDRRAYCKPYGGEMMSWDLVMDGNTNDFGSIEKKDYSTVLLPHDWEEGLVGKTDILLLSSHADDEQLFFAGLLPYYTQVKKLAVQVVYATDHAQSTGRILERLNGLWGVGVRNYPDSLHYPDVYSESYQGALSNLKSSGKNEEQVIEDIHNMIMKYRPQVIVTHDVNGEYGHGMHMLMSGALQKCLEKHAGEYDFLKKVYLHLYDENKIVFSAIDESFDELSGLTPFQYTQKYGFSEHKSQHYTWFYEWLYGKNNTKTSAKNDIKTYNPLYYGLCYGDSSLDVNKNDLFESLVSYEEQERIRLEEEERLVREREAQALEEQRLLEAKLAKQKIVDIIIIVVFIIVLILAIKIVCSDKKRRRK